mmetsp:Transcript_19198/g.61467  ORF Transcript_19198/g.61467 Transcript_19198/m.61467 type:complete len:209 (+) Transcript_19198:3290-3916(+)
MCALLKKFHASFTPLSSCCKYWHITGGGTRAMPKHSVGRSSLAHVWVRTAVHVVGESISRARAEVVNELQVLQVMHACLTLRTFRTRENGVTSPRPTTLPDLPQWALTAKARGLFNLCLARPRLPPNQGNPRPIDCSRIQSKHLDDCFRTKSVQTDCERTKRMHMRWLADNDNVLPAQSHLYERARPAFRYASRSANFFATASPYVSC